MLLSPFEYIKTLLLLNDNLENILLQIFLPHFCENPAEIEN